MATKTATIKATAATKQVATKPAPKAKAIAAPVVATNAPAALPATVPAVAVPAAPVAPAPATTAATKVGRYASTNWQPHHVITGIKPNPKQVGSKSYARYALHTPGQTVAQYVAACVAHGQQHPASGSNATLAGLDLRWGVQHGFFTIVAPQE
jgi:hypothetical protein